MPTSTEDRITTTVVDVVRTGEQIVVPEAISLELAIATLTRAQQAELAVVRIHETVNALPLDGGHAFMLALRQKFGYVSLRDTPGFFGSDPPVMVTVQTGPDEYVQVPWGRMQVPGLDGYLETGFERDVRGRLKFAINGQVRRKGEKLVKELAQLTREIVRAQSLFRGKAFRMKFRDDDNEIIAMPEPQFIDLRSVREEELIFAQPVQHAIATSLFTPIERTDEARAHGIPLKRGILLAGPYGVGKTLAAMVTAAKAHRHGWTFIYCESVRDLSEAVEMARQYAPAVVFAEDIDRVANGKRTAEMDELLNTIDGIDGKSSEIMVVLTTNDVEAINQALLRPGRLDAVINITPPDAVAAEALVRLYGRHLVTEEPLPLASKVLAGHIPAVIRECVERSKLSALRLTKKGERLVISDMALADAATTMQMQLDLLNQKKTAPPSDLETAAKIVAGGIVESAKYRLLK